MNSSWTACLLLAFGLIPTANAKTVEATRSVLQRGANCVVGKLPDDAKSYILDDLDDQKTGRLRTKLLDSKCMYLASRRTLTGLGIQGAVSEALLSIENLPSLAEVSNIAPLKHSDPDSVPLEYSGAGPSLKNYLRAMGHTFVAGECVVRANPEQARTLLTTHLGSAEESKVLRDLDPVFTGCAKGASLIAGVEAFRATIAVNYYRLAHAPRLATASAGGAK